MNFPEEADKLKCELARRACELAKLDGRLMPEHHHFSEAIMEIMAAGFQATLELIDQHYQRKYNGALGGPHEQN